MQFYVSIFIAELGKFGFSNELDQLLDFFQRQSLALDT